MRQYVGKSTILKIFSKHGFSAIGTCAKKHDNTVITKLNIRGPDLLICCEKSNVDVCVFLLTFTPPKRLSNYYRNGRYGNTRWQSVNSCLD